jgi:effector-binding domain-containing protein
MEIKNVKQTNVFGKEVKTSLKTIWNHVQVLPKEIMNEMVQKNVNAQGPQIWTYKGADGNPETIFDLMVGFPVENSNVDSSINTLPDFNCASIIHKGDWSKFNETYCLVIGEVMKNGYQMTGECREIYHTVDFENVENNITEIQIGIK